MMNSTIGRSLIVVAMLAALVAGCSTTDPAPPTAPTDGTDGQQVHEVSVVSFAFEPEVLEVVIGDTVQWTNDAGVDHTVTSEDDAFADILNPGETFEHTFDLAGTFEYFCSIHPSMVATIEVAG